MNKFSKISLWIIHLTIIPLFEMFSYAFLAFKVYQWYMPLIFVAVPVITFGQAFALSSLICILGAPLSFKLLFEVAYHELYLKRMDHEVAEEIDENRTDVWHLIKISSLKLCGVWCCILLVLGMSYLMPYFINFLNFIHG